MLALKRNKTLALADAEERTRHGTSEGQQHSCVVIMVRVAWRSTRVTPKTSPDALRNSVKETVPSCRS